MFNIAVCDDSVEILNQIKQIIESRPEVFSEEYKVDIFNRGSLLCERLESGEKYDLIFLDIMMPEMDGLDVGKYIRKMQSDHHTQIVYISAESKYAMDLFNVQPMNFLLKPVCEEKLIETLKLAISIITGQRAIFSFEYKKEIYREPLERVLYFSSEGRKIIIHTTNGNRMFYGKLDKIVNQLDERNFMYIHKSYIVNYEFVKRIRSDSVIMENDEEIPISRNRRDEISKRWKGQRFS